MTQWAILVTLTSTCLRICRIVMMKGLAALGIRHFCMKGEKPVAVSGRELWLQSPSCLQTPCVIFSCLRCFACCQRCCRYSHYLDRLSSSTPDKYFFLQNGRGRTGKLIGVQKRTVTSPPSKFHDSREARRRPVSLLFSPAFVHTGWQLPLPSERQCGCDSATT